MSKVNLRRDHTVVTLMNRVSAKHLAEYKMINIHTILKRDCTVIALIDRVSAYFT